MKITDIKTYAAKEWRTFLFVVIETDEGHYGLGESGITGREQAVAGLIQHLKPLLIGQDPFRTEHIWQMLWRGGFFPAGQLLTSAIAAIDIALWDIKGKALGVPVYQLLGGRVRDRVLCYTHLHGAGTDQLFIAAEQAITAGWKCLRWEFAEQGDVFEPRPQIEQAVEEWAALRERFGNTIELAFDGHARLNVPDAIRYCRAVEQYRPFFIEDPIRSENSMAYQRLRTQTSVPLAAGEHFGTKWDFKILVENELIDYGRIDMCIAGGFTEAQKIMSLCELHSIDIAVHNPIGPVSTAACLHLNLACPNFAVQELPKRPGESLSDLVQHQPQWQDGYLLAPQRPGLGVTFNPDALDKYPFAITELPHRQRADGSFTNW